MIKSIIDVAVVVSNANKSAEWYKEKLGLEIRAKEGHWVTVAPKGPGPVLHLCETTPLRPAVSDGDRLGRGRVVLRCRFPRCQRVLLVG